MIPTRLHEVARAVRGRLAGGAHPDATVTAPLTVDSRAVEPGGLFAAVAGERVDGHAYAAAAIDAGAVAVLAGREVDAPCVVVDDVVAAIGALAEAVLARLPGTTVVGVTGSAGKTTTKDLLAHVLAAAGPVVAPPGSHNNEIGLPMTVLRADEGTRHLVLEYSARGVGHIRYLTGIAPPRVGVVLNVGSAHLGEFGSREAIALAKGELVEALPPGGLAVLNEDDPLVRGMRERTRADVVTFGLGAADVRAADVRLDARGRPVFRLEAGGGSAEVQLRLHGRHLVHNALATAAVALRSDLGLDAVAERLSAAEPASRWRMEVVDRADGVTVVNDAYNANPESMRAALDAVAAIARGPGRARRSWAVLGYMAELGPAADEEHEGVGRHAEAVGVDAVVAVGPEAAGIARGAGASARSAPDVDAAARLLAAELRPGDVVLVKASRAAGLERVAQALLAEPAGEVPA